MKRRFLFLTRCGDEEAELAQSAERTTLNRVVVGSIPTFGVGSILVFVLLNTS